MIFDQFFQISGRGLVATVSLEKNEKVKSGDIVTLQGQRYTVTGVELYGEYKRNVGLLLKKLEDAEIQNDLGKDI